MSRLFIIAALVLGLDQASKYLVVHAMNLKALGSIEVFPPFLSFEMAWNRGVNFGLFSNDADAMRFILVGLAVGISIWLIIWSRRSNSTTVVVSAAFLVGGALGNALDRLLYGAVADFLNMSCCGIRNPYAFNVADIAIFAGAVGLILFSGNRVNNP